MKREIKIIGICGKMGSGKDTLANIIKSSFPMFEIRKFARAVREFVSEITEIDVDKMETTEQKSYVFSMILDSSILLDRIKSAFLNLISFPATGQCYMIVLPGGKAIKGDIHKIATDIYKILTGTKYVDDEYISLNKTIGQLLQLVGSDCMRNLIDENIWVSILRERWIESNKPIIIISDVRFDNEVEMIKREGGIVIKIERPSNISSSDGRSKTHISESTVDSLKYDKLIINDSTIDDLGRKFFLIWDEVNNNIIYNEIKPILYDCLSDIKTEENINDLGFIKLIDVMPRMVDKNSIGCESAIVQSARVSYGAGTSSSRSDTALIRYLLRNKHMTPFEMIQLKFFIKCPMFTATQWIRHRSASINQESARYSIISDEFYIPENSSLCYQSKTNKQGSDNTIINDVSDIKEDIIKSYNNSYKTYNDNIQRGLAREMSRIVLPEGRYTKFYWSINLRNLLHFLELRMEKHAQENIRQYATAIYEIIKKLYPVTIAAYDDYITNSMVLSSNEVKYISGNKTIKLSSTEMIELKNKMEIMNISDK
jgi:thymidylate synthase (FAD)